MEHIPLPHDRDPFVVDVPLLARDVHHYDGFGFDTFPARHGFTNEVIASDKTPDEVQSFAQDWLFFCLCWHYCTSDVQGSLSGSVRAIMLAGMSHLTSRSVLIS